MSLFGRIVSDDQAEDAVVILLKKWLPTYMSEVERQVGLTPGYYDRPQPGSYTVRGDFDSFPEDMVPLVVVVSPGIVEDPPKRGRQQTYSAAFQINVTCVCESTDEVETRRYAQRMGAAIRATMIQHQSLDHALDETVQGIDWAGERNKLVVNPGPENRTLWVNQQIFLVGVDEVLSKIAGPGVVPPQIDSHTEWPDPQIAEAVTTTVRRS